MKISRNTTASPELSRRIEDFAQRVRVKLKVYGVGGLRIADASVMPRVTTGNTMAPCVVIGEHAAALLSSEHKLKDSSLEATIGTKQAYKDSDLTQEKFASTSSIV
jgi:hypothetical protein